MQLSLGCVPRVFLRLKPVWLCVVLCCLAALTLRGQTTVVINPVQDNTLYESATGNLSNGKGDFIFAGRTNQSSGSIRRAIVKFSLDGIVSAGATITNVSLTMTVNKVADNISRSTALHAVLADWGEGNSNANNQEGMGATAQTNDATWIHRFYSASTWTTVGGDFNATPSASLNITGNGNYTWTSAQMIADVQNWLDNPTANFGWLVLGNESVLNTTKRFASREHPTTTSRPRLSITYTLPCVNPAISSFTATPSSGCSGDGVELAVTGSLNSATAWHLYTSACGTTPVASNADGIFNVSPAATTTYYVRGEGGCITPGTCTEVMVTVVPDDDPGFSYEASQYCQAGADPLPDITGTGGGIFSSNPAGLQLNAASGLIDLSLSQPGEYTITYTTSGSCPASDQFMLELFSEENEETEISICEGEDFLFGTQMLTESGVYVEVFESMNGCDSTVTLTLNVNPVFDEQEEASICEGESFILGSQTLTAAGEYVEIFESLTGCDSTVSLTLNVNPVFDETEETIICQGESYTLGSQTLTSAGVYTEVFQTDVGCDSTVSLTLHVNPVFSEARQISICEGDNFQFGTQDLTTPGAYVEVFESVHGCDSTVTLTLEVIDFFEQSVEIAICEGDSFIFGTQTLTVDGEYVEVFQSVAGCDSIVTLILQVNPVFHESAEQTICQGDQFIFGTQVLTSAGLYEEIFHAVTGCDSIVSLTLSVTVVDVEVERQDVTLIASASNATFQWVDCGNNNTPISNETGNSFTPSMNGNYAVHVTQHGCMDISACIEIVVVGVEGDIANLISLYPNPVQDKLNITIDAVHAHATLDLFNLYGQLLESKQYFTNEVELDFSDVNPGVYYVRVQFGSTTKTIKVIKK